MSILFESGELLHGTTLHNAQLIMLSELMPSRGDFINQMYGEGNENAAGEPGVFFANPNDDDGIWGAGNAMRAAVSRLLGKTWHNVTLDDIAMHGALVVVEPDEYSTYKHEEDGSSISLTGYKTYADPPVGCETGDYYSFEAQTGSRLIIGQELVSLVCTIRRYGHDGTWLFKFDSECQPSSSTFNT